MVTAVFADLAAEFERRVSSIVWASVSSVNARGQTRVRVLHPVWEHLDAPDGPTGWVGTRRHGSMARHLAVNPHVSVAYVRSSHDPMRTEQLYADCTAEWADGMKTRQHVWDLMASLPKPYGFDPALAFESPEDETFGYLRLTPWRIELASLSAAEGWNQEIWRRG